MAKSKENNAVETANKQTYLGQASDEQIQAWKAQFGIITLIKIKNRDKSVSVAYLKSPDRQTASLAYTHLANKRMLDAGAVFLNNCWLGGDERMKTDDDMYIAATQYAFESLDLLEGSAEKL
ncbi:hypothetical protein [Sphingobacterium spiritivorum]|uniref:hypothetical protein n=1 Tax=Sphingobacterium spiritivorum TaxID=258 RepID=UPI003DA5F9C0